MMTILENMELAGMNKRGPGAILLVEDEALIAMAEQRVLEKYGYTVVVVSTGETAIEAVDTLTDIDLILMDINLGPGMDGTQAAVRILQRHDLPLVFLSSHAEREVVEKTEGITSYGYILKNSGETVLIASVKMAFRLFEAKLNGKAQEAALRASEARQRAIFENMAAACSVDEIIFENGVAVDYRILDVNPSYEKVTGVSRSRALGALASTLYGTARPAFIETFGEVARTGEPAFFEAYFEPIGKQLFITVGCPEPGKVTVVFNDITDRKALEEKLKISDRIFTHSIDMLCVAGFDGYFKVLNPAWERTLGWSNAELLGRPWLDFVHPDDRDLTDDVGTVLVNGREVYQFENRYICKSGAVRWLSWNSFPYPEDGIMFGVARDVTRQKSTEAALQESERTFRALFEKGPIGVAYHQMIYDDAGKALDYRFIATNQSYQELTGVDPAGKLVTEAFPGIQNDPFDWTGTYGQVARTGRDIRFQQHLSTNDRWYDIVAYQYKPDHFVTAFLEITEQKRIEQTLYNEKERLRVTLQSIGDAVIATDLDGRIELMNGVAERLTGWTQHAARDKPLDEVFRIVNANTRQPCANPVEKTLREGCVVGLANHTILLAADGTERSIADSAAPIRDASGRILGVVLVFRDVSAEYSMMDALRASESELKKVQAVAGTDRPPAP
jgi:PAS domain S-box-containing protein